MTFLGYAKTGAVVLCSSALCVLAVHAAGLLPAISNTQEARVMNAIAPSDSPCPRDMVVVRHAAEPFCIDTYEASPQSSCLFPNPMNVQETVMNITAAECMPEAREGALPWTYVSRQQAKLACAKAGKRLPTAAEWYAAALGTVGDCVVDATGPERGDTQTTCVSSAGAYDMVGNVWEWVDEDVVDGVWRGRSMPPDGYVTEADVDGVPLSTGATSTARYVSTRYWGDDTALTSMMRGGYFKSGNDAGIYSVYAASPETFAGRGVGFRCVISLQNTI